jgi:hypothetical protein
VVRIVYEAFFSKHLHAGSPHTSTLYFILAPQLRPVDVSWESSAAKLRYCSVGEWGFFLVRQFVSSAGPRDLPSMVEQPKIPCAVKPVSAGKRKCSHSRCNIRGVELILSSSFHTNQISNNLVQNVVYQDQT